MIPICERTKKLFEPPYYDIYDNDKLVISLNDNGTKFIIDAYRSWPDGGRYNCSEGLREILKRLPERTDCKGHGTFHAYFVPATDISVELLDALVPAANRQYEPEAYNLWQQILQRSRLADYVATAISDYKLDKKVPSHNYELREDAPLSEYQQVALCAQKASTGFGLFMEQGTGKTPVMIASIMNSAIELRDQYERELEEYNNGIRETKPIKRLYQALVVAPNSVRANWLAEFNAFATRAGRVTILRGDALNRVKLLIDALSPDDSDDDLLYTVVVCGYATVWRSWESFKMIKWDLVALDEAHAIKDPKSTQSKHALELRDRADQRVVLTGTPIGNSVMDMYMLLEFMEKGGSGFSNFAEFKRFYGVYENRGGRQVLVDCQNLPFLQERLARKSFYISKKEALPNLPEKLFDIVECEMSEVQTEFYNKLATQLAIEIEKQLASDLDRSMVIHNILTQLLRLAQVTSGFISWDEVVDPLTGNVLQTKHIEGFDPCLKADKLIEDLLALPKDEKAIIWTCFTPDIDYLSWRLQCLDVKHVVFYGDMTDDQRQEAIATYNNDRECRFIIGTMQSGGAGLNLLGYDKTRADEYETDTTLIAYYAKNWSQILFSQSSDRGHRRGTRRPVRISRYIVPNTIDTIIDNRVLAKIEVAMEVGDLSEIMVALKGGYRGDN